MGSRVTAQACYLYHRLPPSCSSISPNPSKHDVSRIPPFRLSLATLSLPRHPAAAVQLNDAAVATASTQEAPTVTRSKSYVWVNPRSRRASQLRKDSHDARQASLTEVARALDSCGDDQLPALLVAYSDKLSLSEQDAVSVINGMSNPDAALLALRFFRDRLNPDKDEAVIIYNVTMKVLRNCQDLPRAEQLFDEMLQRGVAPDNVTFSTLITCARKCNLPDKAVEWFEKMPAFRLHPDDVTFSVMIDAYGRSGNVEMALSLYDRARTEKWRLDPIAFSTLIKVHCTSGNYDGCLNVYEEMKALGFKTNLGTFNILLDAMGRAKRPWQAKAIYGELLSQGLTPNPTTYAALLRAYCRGRYGADALQVYMEMKEKGMSLHLVLYNSLLAMLAHLGLVDEAVEVYEDMRASETMPDTWTFSPLITIFSCSGEVSKVEKVFNEMLEAGIQPTIFILTSLVQCYGNARLTDNVVRTCELLFELGLVPDEQFCGCLLNVLSQSPREELWKIIGCIERADAKLGHVVKLLVDEQGSQGDFEQEAAQLITSVATDAKKAYCNCLIDLCINLNMLERGCYLLDLGVRLDIYKNLQSRSTTQWSLHLKGLSIGAALTALHAWENDLSNALEAEDLLPPLLGINTGHGKHKFSAKSLAGVVESRLKELGAPFHEAPDQVGWLLTTKVAAESWLESRKPTEVVAA